MQTRYAPVPASCSASGASRHRLSFLPTLIVTAPTSLRSGNPTGAPPGALLGSRSVHRSSRATRDGRSTRNKGAVGRESNKRARENQDVSDCAKDVSGPERDHSTTPSTRAPPRVGTVAHARASRAQKLIRILGSLVLLGGLRLDTSSSSRALRARERGARPGEPSFVLRSLWAVEP